MNRKARERKEEAYFIKLGKAIERRISTVSSGWRLPEEMG